jgi:hypothetical protein
MESTMGSRKAERKVVRKAVVRVCQWDDWLVGSLAGGREHKMDVLLVKTPAVETVNWERKLDETKGDLRVG